jgi:hypothetical protein
MQSSKNNGPSSKERISSFPNKGSASDQVASVLSVEVAPAGRVVVAAPVAADLAAGQAVVRANAVPMVCAANNAGPKITARMDPVLPRTLDRVVPALISIR